MKLTWWADLLVWLSLVLIVCAAIYHPNHSTTDKPQPPIKTEDDNLNYDMTPKVDVEKDPEGQE